MRGWDYICSAAKKIDKTVREDAPAKLKQYTPDLSHSAQIMGEIQKMTTGVTRKIDKTVREDAIPKLKQYAPDQRFWMNCGKNAMDEIIMNSGVPGARLLCKSVKKALRNSQSGVQSQPHGEGNENEKIMLMQHKMAEMEREVRMMKLQLAAQTKPSQDAAPNNQPFSPDAVIEVLKESQMSEDCFDHVEREDK